MGQSNSSWSCTASEYSFLQTSYRYTRHLVRGYLVAAAVAAGGAAACHFASAQNMSFLTVCLNLQNTVSLQAYTCKS